LGRQRSRPSEDTSPLGLVQELAEAESQLRAYLTGPAERQNGSLKALPDLLNKVRQSLTQPPIAEGRHSNPSDSAPTVEISQPMKVESPIEEASNRPSKEIVTLLDGLPGYAYLKDARDTYLAANQRFADAVGTHSGDIFGKSDYDFFPRALADSYRRDDLRILDGRESVVDTEEQMLEQGRLVAVATRKVPLKDGNGEVMGLVGLGFDVTERRAMEHALRASEEKFRSLFNGTNDAILLYQLTPKSTQGQFLEANEVACASLGYSREELLQMSPPDIADPAAASDVPDILKELVSQGHATYETIHLTKTGGIIPVEISARLLDLDGLRVVLSVVRDITDRKRVEEALRRSEGMFRALAEASPTIIIVTVGAEERLEYNVEYFNPQFTEVLGYTIEDIPDADHWWPLAYPDHDYRQRVAGQWQSRIESAVRTGLKAEPLEAVVTCKDGSKRTIEFRLAFLGGKNIIFGTDLTERKRAAEALQEAHDLLERRVAERTAALELANQELRNVIQDLTEAEQLIKARERQQAAVAELGRRALAGEGINDLLHDAVVLVAETFGVEYAAVLEQTPGDTHLEARALVGWDASIVESNMLAAGVGSMSGYTLLSKEPIIVDDFGEETRFVVPRAMRKHQLVSGISIAIEGNGRPFGVLSAHSTGGHKFHRDDIHFLEGVVNVLTTALTRAEQEKIHTRLTAIIEATPDYVGTADTAGNIFYLNRAARRMLGISESEDCSKLSIRDNHPGWATRLILAKGIPAAIQDGFWQGETALRTCDGREIPLSQVLISHDASSGEMEFISTVARDITEAKQAEEKLRQREREVTTLLDSLPAYAFLKDANYRYVTANQAFCDAVGYTESQLVGKTVWDIFPTDIAEEYHAEDNLILQPGESQRLLTVTEGEFTVGNNRIPVARRKVAVTDESGAVVGLIGLAFDISERKLIEEEVKKTRDLLEVRVQERTAELQRSNEELQQFAYVASHDLQEPLRMVASYVQLLQRRYAGQLDADADEFIAYAVDGATRMQRLINDLLAYSRVGTRGRPMELVDAAVVVDRAVADLQLAISESGATVSKDQLPMIMGDASQLVHVFQNLIGNALKFRGEAAPAVHISAEKKFGETVFHVRDNGIGIPLEFHDRVFLLFQRLHSRAEYPGTGIGLAICKKIIERHGGRIWFDSEPGRGTTFHFTIVERNQTTKV
jgi:PAS domain S-box-containing protein